MLALSAEADLGRDGEEACTPGFGHTVREVAWQARDARPRLSVLLLEDVRDVSAVVLLLADWPWQVEVVY